MKPYYQDGAAGITIYCGDCREILPRLTERPALVLTDPPYGAKERTNRASNGRGYSKQKQWPSRDHPPVIGDDKPFDPAPILELAPAVILWGANYYADKLPVSRCWLVWDKRNGMTPNDNADCEIAWTNINAPARLFAHLWNGLCRASEVGQKVLHPTQKPVALMRWCLQRARLPPGALVLDPYMGSGPIAQACKELGYRYIGIELVESYCEIAVCRLAQEVMPLDIKA